MILYLDSVEPGAIRSMPAVKERITCRQATQAQKHKPLNPKLGLRLQPGSTLQWFPIGHFWLFQKLAPRGENMWPIGWLEPPIIPSNLVRVLLDADLWHFGILTSRMHMAWLRQIGGRLESRYRYSIGIVYQPLPLARNYRPATRKGTLACPGRA